MISSCGEARARPPANRAYVQHGAGTDAAVEGAGGTVIAAKHSRNVYKTVHRHPPSCVRVFNRVQVVAKRVLTLHLTVRTFSVAQALALRGKVPEGPS